MHKSSSATAESVYVLPHEISAEAVAESLQALLRSRHHPIARHRFTALDTFDGRVRRARALLTRGSLNGASAVAWHPRGGRDQLAVGLKEPVSFAWDLPEGPLQRGVASVIGPRRLLDQADAEEQGAVLEMLDDRGKAIARLRIASGRARLPLPDSAWRPLPTFITLTPLIGYEDACRRLVPIVESRPGIERCPEGTLDVMLRRIGAPVRGDLSSPAVDLDPRVRADEGARQIHLALVAMLTANEPGLRADLDTEFLHDFRVGVRRTRSLLRQIRGVFPHDAVQHFSTEFSWIGRLTSAARDLDVLLLALRARQGGLPHHDLDAILSFLGRAQRQEHEGLVRALDSGRYERLISDWKGFLERPSASNPEPPNASGALSAVVAERAWRLSRRIARSAETIDDRAPAERLHEIRIDAKKLRYLVDVSHVFFDAADLECVLTALKKVQRVLGDFNDASVQERRLVECGHALGAAGGPPGALLALGRLAEERRRRREDLHGKVIEKLNEFRARETRAACRRAFKRAQAKGA